MRSLGVDPGEARTGLALSDALGLIARPLEVVRSRDVQQVLERIAAIVAEREVARIVVGHPKNMDGSIGPQARIAEEFARQLAEKLPEVEVQRWDERLSSAQAERVLQEAGLRREERKARRDMVAAQIILQSWLDAHRNAV